MKTPSLLFIVLVYSSLSPAQPQENLKSEENCAILMRVATTPQEAIISRMDFQLRDRDFQTEHEMEGQIIGFKDFLKRGGPITKQVLRALMSQPKFKASLAKLKGIQPNLQPSITVWTDKLNKGDYPNTRSPVWHTDGPGVILADNNPIKLTYDPGDIFIVHFSSENASISQTELIVGARRDLTRVETEDLSRAILTEDMDGHPLDSLINQLSDTLLTYRLNDGELLHISSEVIHRRTRAQQSGWRYFLRISFDYYAGTWAESISK